MYQKESQNLVQLNIFNTDNQSYHWRRDVYYVSGAFPSSFHVHSLI